MTGDYRSLALTPLVFAMPRPMAEALGWPATEIGYSDIIALAKDPQGWASKGHPEWGAFKLGKTNPNFSTSGLNATIATYYAATGKTKGLGSDDVGSPQVRDFVAGVEQSVVHYGDTTLTFLANLYRADQRGRGLTYISAVTIEEKSILDYNRGDPEGSRPPDQPGVSPRVPLVAVYPKEGTLFSDNPLFVLNAPWNDADHQAAAQAFIDFATTNRDAQSRTLRYGFRPGSPDVPLGAPITVENGLDPKKPSTVLEVPKPATVARILQTWEQTRKRARVLLVLDVSGSMGDSVTQSETKLDLAKRAIQDSLPEFEAGDQVGFWIFTTDLPGGADFAELVPISDSVVTSEQIRGRLAPLTPLNGTPLYTTILNSVQSVQSSYDPTRINAVVLLTDGQNEDKRNDDKGALLQTLSNGTKESQQPVRVFPIAYGKDADLGTLRDVAEATDSAVYDSSNPAAIVQVFQAVISNF
jgi:Ca-activated chloride channel family protein